MPLSFRQALSRVELIKNGKLSSQFDRNVFFVSKPNEKKWLLMHQRIEMCNIY